MKLTFGNETLEAEKIVKTDTDIVGYTNDIEVFAFRGISDFSLFTFDINLDEAKTEQKELISQACQSAIVGGFTSNAYQNTAKTYDSTLEDQANITGNALAATSKIAGVPECQDDKFYYHAKGENFAEWQASECLQLARDFKVYKEQQLIKSKQLQAYIDTLTTVEDVQKVTWNKEIPTT